MHEKRSSSSRPLLLAFLITLSLLAVEFVAAILSNSLALLADAGHMAADSTALGMALWASLSSARAADGRKSYGYGRREVLVALINAVFLFAVAGYTVLKAAGRIAAPEPVAGVGMLAVAVAGLLANVASGLILLRSARRSINVRAALFHVVGDGLGSVGVLAAALVIVLTGWTMADPIVSLVICGLIVMGAMRLFFESWHILMEGTPRGFDRGEARRLIGAIPGVVSTHDIHAWSITSGKLAATAHIIIEEKASPEQVRLEAVRLFREKWAIRHVTLQIVKADERFSCTEEVCCSMSDEGPPTHDH